MSVAAKNFNVSSDLDEKRRVNEALRAAAIQGDVPRMQRQLNAGADIDYPDVNKLPPLYFAAMGLHLEAVKFLLDKGAKVDGGIAANLPDTALIQMSGTEEGLPMMKLLLTYHADINARNHAGRTALNEALQLAREDAALYLIEQGADPNIADKEGMTPLMAALKKNLRQAALYLVKHGADFESAKLFNASIRDNTRTKGWQEVVAAIDETIQRREDERVRKIEEARAAFEADMAAAPILQHRMQVGRPIILKSRH